MEQGKWELKERMFFPQRKTSQASESSGTSMTRIIIDKVEMGGGI